MTKKELLLLPYEKYGVEIPLLDELYIIPTRRKHDSGYMCMEIVGINKEGYAKNLAGGCDVVHFPSLMDKLTTGHFNMDIPSDCRCFRIFTLKGKIQVSWYGLSDFEFNIVGE